MMNENKNYEINYTHYIENLYRPKENVDLNFLFENNKLPHNYSIPNRIDLTHLDVFSIDPEGCEDADDAFSIYKEKEVLYLAIHIADPTEYISLKSKF